MPAPDMDDSPLERLHKRLYAKDAVPTVHESGLPVGSAAPAEHWTPSPVSVPKHRVSGAALFLGFAALFFVIAGSATAFILFMGGRSVSSDHVDIAIEGPTTVAGGEGVPFLITVKNANPVAVTNASITLQYPDGTTDAEDTSKPLTHYTESLGDIPAGGSVRVSTRAAFFGTENQKLSIPISVEYHTSNSNALFEKKKDYPLVISTSPIGLSVTSLSEIASGQQLTLSVLVRSNATAPLQNVAVRGEYPFGFSPTATSPTTSSDGLFVLGTLAPGEEREIRVTGVLSGQDGENRVFRFTAGSLKSETAKDFAVSYTVSDASITIAKPFFTVALALNRDDGPIVVARAGEPIAGLLTWSNALQTSITDGTISIALSGDALDSGSVDVTNGFYRSSDRTIQYNRDTASSLASVKPGDTGNGSFMFSSKTSPELRNPTITLAVSVSGRRIGENKVPETVSATLTRTIKIQTDMTLSMRAMHTSGPFENSGPIPPRADTETTYTIALVAKNTVNSVANTTVKLTLPSYVRFTNVVQPAGSIKFNESTREVTWTIGDMPADTTKEGFFQVALLPSLSQKGTSPALVSSATVSGVDRFVQKQISATAPFVTTDTKADTGYVNTYGIIEP